MTKEQRNKQYIIDFLERKVKFIKTVPDFPSEYLQTFEDLLFSALSTADDDVPGLESIAVDVDATIDAVVALGFPHYKPVNEKYQKLWDSLQTS